MPRRWARSARFASVRSLSPAGTSSATAVSGPAPGPMIIARSLGHQRTWGTSAVLSFLRLSEVNVAMLQACLPPATGCGGVGYQVDLLAAGLSQRGHDVTVFVVDEPPTARSYRAVQVPTSGGRSRRILGVGRSFARLDLSTFDVVHAHGDDWLFGRRPRVRTFYGSALMEAKTATRWLRRGSQLCYYALEWLSSVNPFSVAISESTRGCLPLVRGCIPCAFDPNVFYPGEQRTTEPSMLFVAGTLAGRKRGELLLHTFDEVRRSIPEARLTIVSRDVVTRPGVTCLSNVDAATLGSLYRSHWLLCSTSSYEGFGVPYVEALASGLPIVTTANDGANEVLRGGELGVICSTAELAAAVTCLIQDDAQRSRLATSGVEAAKPYSLDSVVSRYESLYREVAAATVG